MKNKFGRIALLMIGTIVVLLISCKGSSTKNANKTGAPKKLEMPAIPTHLTTPEQRADFLTRHFWDNFDFTDTSYIRHAEITEQAFVDFVDILHRTNRLAAQAGIDTLMKRAETDSLIYAHFRFLAEKYLYDPNSPFRSDELYMSVLESEIASSKLNDTAKIRPKYLLELAQKNRIGTKALDFEYTTANGSHSSLYATTAEYLLMFFYHPECHTCIETQKMIEESPVIGAMLQNGKLKIIAVYADKDLGVWEDYKKNIPRQWINAYDKLQVINSTKIYDLKASPTLYLLDKNKIVLLKDPQLDIVERYLLSLSGS